MTPHASYPTLPAGTVIQQADAELISEPTGLASTVEVFRGYYNDIVTNGRLNLSTGGSITRTYRAPHPTFPSLLAYGVKIKRGKGVLNDYQLPIPVAAKRRTFQRRSRGGSSGLCLRPRKDFLTYG